MWQRNVLIWTGCQWREWRRVQFKEGIEARTEFSSIQNMHLFQDYVRFVRLSLYKILISLIDSIYHSPFFITYFKFLNVQISKRRLRRQALSLWLLCRLCFVICWTRTGTLSTSRTIWTGSPRSSSVEQASKTYWRWIARFYLWIASTRRTGIECHYLWSTKWLYRASTSFEL